MLSSNNGSTRPSGATIVTRTGSGPGTDTHARLSIANASSPTISTRSSDGLMSRISKLCVAVAWSTSKETGAESITSSPSNTRTTPALGPVALRINRTKTRQSSVSTRSRCALSATIPRFRRAAPSGTLGTSSPDAPESGNESDENPPPSEKTHTSVSTRSDSSSTRPSNRSMSSIATDTSPG